MTVPYTAPWPAPPRSGKLVTLQLIGDVQTAWETYRPTPGTLQRTTYDAIGRDMRDRLLAAPPDARFQMGDVSDGNANADVALLQQRFALFDQWCGDYGITTHKIMGNHDTPANPLVFTPAQWATYWGVPSPSYTVDLGPVRGIVLGPTGSLINDSANPLSSAVPVRPLSPADLAWLDARLAEDTRPTIVLNHASLKQEATNYDPARRWWNVQSTEASWAEASEPLQVLNVHAHVVAYMHGHTHQHYAESPDNVTLLNVGGRSIVGVDAGATYTQGSGFGAGLPVTFYATLLDDGKTVDVRWRDHERSLWAGVPGRGRVHRLTAG